MFVVGLTGGIGSGKSTVAALFAERGVPIIDADLAAREETLPDTPGYRAIVGHFSAGILQEDGNLNRTKLRDIIFADAQERLWLEEILHPLIRKNMASQIQALNTPYCIAVIPLLLEVEFYHFINRILVVDTPEPLQIKRVMDRDKTSEQEVKAILHTQATRENRLAHAQDVIINDGNPADLIPQVDKLHQLYLQMHA